MSYLVAFAPDAGTRIVRQVVLQQLHHARIGF